MNVVLLSGLNVTKLWQIIREFRLQFLIENVNIVNTLLTCFVEDSVLYHDTQIESDLLDGVEIELEKYAKLSTQTNICLASQASSSHS